MVIWISNYMSFLFVWTEHNSLRIEIICETNAWKSCEIDCKSNAIESVQFENGATAHVQSVKTGSFFLRMPDKSMDKTVAHIMTGSMWMRKKVLYNYTFIFRSFLAKEYNTSILCCLNSCFNENQNVDCSQWYSLHHRRRIANRAHRYRWPNVFTTQRRRRKQNWSVSQKRKSLNAKATTKRNVLVMRCRYVLHL